MPYKREGRWILVFVNRAWRKWKQYKTVEAAQRMLSYWQARYENEEKK